MMMSSEISWPESITFFASLPSGVPAFTAARSMSPVEICGMPNFSRMNCACVPLPAPGGPRRISRMKVASFNHSTHRIEVLRRVDPRWNLGFADRYRNAETVPEHAQLLQRLRRLQRRRLQPRVPLEEADAVAVDPGVAMGLAAALARVRNARAREVERVALRVHHDLHHVWIAERGLVVDGVAGRGHARLRFFAEQISNLRDQARGNQRLVALHVHYDLVVPELELARRLREAIGARRMIRARHDRAMPMRLDDIEDALVVGRDVHAGGAALRRALAHVHHHRLAGEVGERLAREAAGRVARRDDDVELQTTSSCGGSFLASSSSITGIPSLTG